MENDGVATALCLQWAEELGLENPRVAYRLPHPGGKTEIYCVEGENLISGEERSGQTMKHWFEVAD